MIIIEHLLIYRMYFILLYLNIQKWSYICFLNPLRGGKIEKIVFQVRNMFNEMNILYSYVSLCYGIKS